MKRKTLSKSLRSYISLVIAGMLLLSACGRTADVPDDEDKPDTVITEEDIRDRIEDVGKDYDGLEDDDGKFTLFGGTTNGGMVMYEAATVCDAEEAVSSPSVSIPTEPVIIDQPWNTEGYNQITEAGFITTGVNRFSTFGADVDTAT